MKIIFDLDDTLYNSKELREKRERKILEFLGDRSKEFQELRKSNTTIGSLSKLGIDRGAFFKIMEEVPINLNKDEKLRVILKNLKERCRLIVLSNISYSCVKKSLEQLGIIDLIDKFYGGDNFLASKPSEEIFSIVEKGDICVGNNFNKDLLVPKKKGAVTILISEKNNPDSDFTIKSIYDIEKVI